MMRLWPVTANATPLCFCAFDPCCTDQWTVSEARQSLQVVLRGAEVAAFWSEFIPSVQRARGDWASLPSRAREVADARP